MTDPAALDALDRAATQGEWYTLDAPWLPSDVETSILAGSPDPHVATFVCDFDQWAMDDDDERKSANPDADAAFIVALVNAYRTGQLVPRAAVEGAVKTLKALRYWFDTDEEILAAMSHDERADNARQIAKIDAALASLKPESHHG